jgi:glycerol kinase
MNLHTLEWDQDLLDLMRIPRALLPEIRSSSEVYGSAVGDVSGVPVGGVLGDQSASLFGHTCWWRPRSGVNGSGCRFLGHVMRLL